MPYDRERRAVRYRQQREFGQAYHQRNRESVLARQRERYRANPEVAIRRVRLRFAALTAEAKALQSWVSKQQRIGQPANAAVIAYAESLLRDPCAYCGATDAPRQIDHIVPLSRGGETSAENLTAACASCNQRKGTRCLLAYVAIVMQPVSRKALYMREWTARNRERVNAERRARARAKREAVSATN